MGAGTPEWRSADRADAAGFQFRRRTHLEENVHDLAFPATRMRKIKHHALKLTCGEVGVKNYLRRGSLPGGSFPGGSFPGSAAGFSCTRSRYRPHPQTAPPLIRRSGHLPPAGRRLRGLSTTGCARAAAIHKVELALIAARTRQSARRAIGSRGEHPSWRAEIAGCDQDRYRVGWASRNVCARVMVEKSE